MVTQKDKGKTKTFHFFIKTIEPQRRKKKIEEGKKKI